MLVGVCVCVCFMGELTGCETSLAASSVFHDTLTRVAVLQMRKTACVCLNCVGAC